MLIYLYWLIIILCALGMFAPPTYARLTSVVTLVLFIIIGLESFPVPL